MNVTLTIVNTKRSGEKYVKYPKTAMEKYYKKRNNTWGNHVSQEEKTGIEKFQTSGLTFPLMSMWQYYLMEWYWSPYQSQNGTSKVNIIFTANKDSRP